MGSYFPNQGLNPHPVHWKSGVLTPGLTGKFQIFYILPFSTYSIFFLLKKIILLKDKESLYSQGAANDCF